MSQYQNRDRLRTGSIRLATILINDGNRTEWSPFRSVIIRVINKIGRQRNGRPICLITSMITERIVLLPINHNNYNFRGNKMHPFSLSSVTN